MEKATTQYEILESETFHKWVDAYNSREAGVHHSFACSNSAVLRDSHRDGTRLRALVNRFSAPEQRPAPCCRLPENRCQQRAAC